MMTRIDDEEKERLFPNGVMNDVAIEFWDFAPAVIDRGKPKVDGWMGARAEAIRIAAFESSWLSQPVKVEKVLRCEVENCQREINESLGLF